MSFALALSGGGDRVVAWEVGVPAGLAGRERGRAVAAQISPRRAA
jgi:hypothetical protein